MTVSKRFWKIPIHCKRSQILLFSFCTSSITKRVPVPRLFTILSLKLELDTMKVRTWTVIRVPLNGNKIYSNRCRKISLQNKTNVSTQKKS